MKRLTIWVPIVGAVLEVVLALRPPSETQVQKRELDHRRFRQIPDHSTAPIVRAADVREPFSVASESSEEATRDAMTDEIRSLLDVRVDQAVEIARLIARRDREAYEALQNCGAPLDEAAIERLRPLLQALDHELDLRVQAHLDGRQRERYCELRREGVIASVTPDGIFVADADSVQESVPDGH